MQLLTALLIAAAAGLAAAHPHELRNALPPAELARRQLAANKRHADFRSRCGGAVVKQRLARRQLRKRQSDDASSAVAVASATTTALTPHYSTIQNTTCLTTPEVTEGPCARASLRSASTS